MSSALHWHKIGHFRCVTVSGKCGYRTMYKMVIYLSVYYPGSAALMNMFLSTFLVERVQIRHYGSPQVEK